MKIRNVTESDVDASFIDFSLLADCIEAVPVVARWYYDEWGHKAPNNSFEDTCKRVEGKLDRDRLPLHLLALDSGTPCGVAQLKIREMDIYPDKELWLGGVYVPPEYRGRGVASCLSDRVAEMAASFSGDSIYLQTERIDGGLYARLGWKPLEQVHYKGLEVLVMERKLIMGERQE